MKKNWLVINLNKKYFLKVGNKVFKCQIGLGGFEKTKRKIEGDKTTPIGKWYLKSLYYRSDKVLRPKLKKKNVLKIKRITKNCGWCDDIKSKLYIICEEENEHLKLCNLRLKELDGRPSILNPLWYFSSYILGSIAGMKDDDWKLGFIVETEKQVKEHLKESILQLPKNDHRSKDFLKQIAKDEEKHKVTVQDIGSNDIPDIIKRGMHVSSKIMKKLTSLI